MKFIKHGYMSIIQQILICDIKHYSFLKSGFLQHNTLIGTSWDSGIYPSDGDASFSEVKIYKCVFMVA